MGHPGTLPLMIALYALGLLAAALFDAVRGTGMDITIVVAFALGFHALARYGAFLKSRYGRQK